jgi:hypothetical protein
MVAESNWAYAGAAHNNIRQAATTLRQVMFPPKETDIATRRFNNPG